MDHTGCEMNATGPDRRAFLTAALAGVASWPFRSAEAFALRAEEGVALRDSEKVLPQGRIVKNGRLKQSVSRWPYNAIPLPDFCKAIADMGLTAIDLLEEPEWAVARDHGLITSMAYAGG